MAKKQIFRTLYGRKLAASVASEDTRGRDIASSLDQIPGKYISNASVSGDQLVLTEIDQTGKTPTETTIRFTGGGGGGGGVQSDWEVEDESNLAFILHKPDLTAKADKTYVDTAVAGKADKTYVDTGLSGKASKTYVDALVGGKADKTYVDTELGKKVDKVDGKGLSTNDYTDVDKQKLAGIGNLPAASGGTSDTLVTTGDKYRWDAKQDAISYYLADAEVVTSGSSSTLVIRKSDGTEVTFAGGGGGGGGAVDSISADGTALAAVGGNVDIPLAVSSTAGQLGEAGLVRGIYEEFQGT